MRRSDIPHEISSTHWLLNFPISLAARRDSASPPPSPRLILSGPRPISGSHSERFVFRSNSAPFDCFLSIYFPSLTWRGFVNLHLTIFLSGIARRIEGARKRSEAVVDRCPHSRPRFARTAADSAICENLREYYVAIVRAIARANEHSPTHVFGICGARKNNPVPPPSSSLLRPCTGASNFEPLTHSP